MVTFYTDEGQYPHTLGRGKVLLKKEGDNNWLDLWHVKEFNLTNTTETLDHESSRGGLKRINKSVVTKQEWSGSFIVDVPILENLRLFLMADDIVDDNQALGSLSSAAYEVNHGLYTDLGYRGLTDVVVKDVTDVTTYVEGTDYVLDAKNGMISPLADGSIGDGDTVHVSADYPAKTIRKAAAGTARSIKRHIWFLSDPPEGIIQEVKGYINLTPSGDLPLITDEWQEFSFDMKFEEHADYDGTLDWRELGAVTSS